MNRLDEKGNLTEKGHAKDHEFLGELQEKKKKWEDNKSKIFVGLITTFLTFIGSSFMLMLVYVFNSKVGK